MTTYLEGMGVNGNNMGIAWIKGLQVSAIHRPSELEVPPEPPHRAPAQPVAAVEGPQGPQGPRGSRPAAPGDPERSAAAAEEHPAAVAVDLGAAPMVDIIKPHHKIASSRKQLDEI